MPVLNIATDFAGQVGVIPRKVAILCNDSLGTVTTLNYLKSATKMGYPLLPTDQVFVDYSGGSGIFRPNIVGSNITLVQIAAG